MNADRTIFQLAWIVILSQRFPRLCFMSLDLVITLSLRDVTIISSGPYTIQIPIYGAFIFENCI